MNAFARAGEPLHCCSARKRLVPPGISTWLGGHAQHALMYMDGAAKKTGINVAEMSRQSLSFRKQHA